MPYISNIISKKISLEEEAIIKTSQAAILQEVASKPERVLMVHVRGDETLYFAGEKCVGAYVEVKLLGQLSVEQKNQITAKICSLYEDTIGIWQDKVYVTFYELAYENWGHNGKTFA